jgi:hypothetical protein
VQSAQPGDPLPGSGAACCAGWVWLSLPVNNELGANVLLPAPAALDRILEDSGYLALAATTPGGVDAGDLLHAVDRVRQVTECGGSLAEAAETLGEPTGKPQAKLSLCLWSRGARKLCEL